MAFTNTVLITGGTSGLGFQAANIIARDHPKYLVVLASRTDPNSAAETINKASKHDNVIFLPLDLSVMAKVRSFVRTWETKSFPPIIALLLNAGLQFRKGLRKTDDGIEATFAVNHVGHALLFHLLLPSLANGARVVVTSSGTHDPAQKSGLPDAIYTTAEELAHPTNVTAQNPGSQRYATSKLANVLWTYALHRRLVKLQEKQINVIAFDPGMIPGTGLAREYTPVLRAVWVYLMPHMIPLLRRIIHPNINTILESATNLAWLAVSNDVKDTSGVYFEGRRKIKSSDESYDESKQEDLWKWTVKNVALDAKEVEKFEISK
jgi:NAD(P)-dependent dehydrogenase (short-subunit alcohol dehydrogenase family)